MIYRIWLLTGLTIHLAVAQPTNPSNGFYTQTVRPLLAKNCLGCHNAKLQQGGFDLSSHAALMKGSDNGPVVVPGDPDRSTLLKLISHTEQPAMPFQAAKLPDEAIAQIARWIREGATMDGATTESMPQADHWAFRLPAKQVPPPGAANPIDAFLQAARADRKLTPSPQADRRTLIRRVYLDLVGLPPSEAEVKAFLEDKAPQAYERVVDQLLASPQYGERWGRHWLDIWRYSDWYGWRKENQVRYSQRHLWRWRDWTVESLNQNKSYGQMIEEMLAGDEIAPNDPNVLRATGYLARSWYRFNRNTWVQEAAEYTSTSFMALTMKCARCHTHKYDPISHVEHYRFRAFFEPIEVRTDRIAGEVDIDKAGVARIFDGDVTTPTYRFIRGNEAAPEKDKPLTPGIPAIFQAKLDIKPITIPFDSRHPDGRDFVYTDLVRDAEQRVEKARATLAKDATNLGAKKRLESLEAEVPALRARIAADQAKYGKNANADAIEALRVEARKLERHATILKAQEELYHANLEMEGAKGEEKKLAAGRSRLEAAVKALGEATETYTPVGKIYPDISSGRRLALAKWIASKDNPLTARVAVNHMWLRHFGKALVPTVFNFGKSGKAPSHPELLDYLAIEFMDSGWDMKRMHRLMVTSNAYQMTSAVVANNANLAIDPDNIYLWRMNPRRMEAEAVRDSLIQIAGKLDRTMGGPELDETKAEQVFRRSLYFRHAPDLQVEMLSVFDLANPIECFERTESVMPQQALALANSGLGYTIARSVADSLSKHTQAAAFVASAFEKVLGRTATPLEIAESIRFLKQQAALYQEPATLTSFSAPSTALLKPAQSPEQRARESLLHVLINHNDFVTIR
ncbi:DUF1553 domain-containing protein [Bryobacter aggregatus]|uniref:DUF1553 domain-containing protein n=1 Tax=Bryobacter aggregatus TaxID=360054 RepID=UPI0005692088|nr:DUF1553 domain-containing protein [Bryobacter aggregatus]